mmetsp:Transcript_85/g.288  ORF Transcript_85/g.288 Transcript_85/m.288 type:complete len:98 (+) Transcript_85:984-1277(+)
MGIGLPVMESKQRQARCALRPSRLLRIVFCAKQHKVFYLPNCRSLSASCKFSFEPSSRLRTDWPRTFRAEYAAPARSASPLAPASRLGRPKEAKFED